MPAAEFSAELARVTARLRDLSPDLLHAPSPAGQGTRAQWAYRSAQRLGELSVEQPSRQLPSLAELEAVNLADVLTVLAYELEQQANQRSVQLASATLVVLRHALR